MIPEKMKAVILTEPTKAEEVRLTDCPVPQVRPEDTLLVRGATCALGYAAIQLAKALGCRVIATAHKESRLPLLAEADEAVLDTGRLAETLPGAALSDTALSGAAIPGKDLSGKALSGKDLSGKNLSGKNLSGKNLSCAARPGVIRSGITKALELVGPKTLSDTLRCVEKGGIVCNTGILGGVYALDGFDPIKDIPNGVYLTGFYSNGPTQEIMDEIFSFLTAHRLQPCVGKCFDFSEIREACEAQDTGAVNGKIVVHISRISDHG